MRNVLAGGRWRRWCVVACSVFGVAVACAAPKPQKRTPGHEDFWRPAPIEDYSPPNTGPRAAAGGGFGAHTGDPPQASENYVFVANPAGRSVIVINSRELTIRSIETGNSPSYLRTIPGADAALVLNVGTGDASVVRVAADGALSSRRLQIVKGANAIEVAPDGKHAVVFFDADAGIAGNDFGDFQSVSVIDLSVGKETSATMAVGFKPERVTFQADGARGFVVTEPGISVLDFEQIAATGPGIAAELTFGSQEVVRSEIVVTADGHYAIAPMPRSTELRMIDLTTGVEIVRDFWALVPLLKDPADWRRLLRAHPPDQPFPEQLNGLPKPYFVGLHYDPERSQLLAVEPGSGEVVRIPIPTGLMHAGAVSKQYVPHDIREVRHLPNTDLVLAYRAGAGVSQLSVIDFAQVPAEPELADGAGGAGGAGDGGDGGGGMDIGGAADAAERAIQTYELRKGIEDVFVAPDGKSAIIRHDRRPGDPNEDGVPLDERILRSAGHTLLHPASGEVKLERTATDIDHVVFSPDGKYAFLLFDDPHLAYPIGDQTNVREVQRIELPRFLANPSILLDSAPLAGAPVPRQTRVFIWQDHPDGRLTFVDWRTGDVQTVTGFELNSRVQN